MPKSREEHAQQWDLRHEDFNDNDFLYDVYDVMRAKSSFAYTDTPFLTPDAGGSWVAVSYSACTAILRDWEHFSSNPTPQGGAEQLPPGDIVITLDPPRVSRSSARCSIRTSPPPAGCNSCSPKYVTRQTD